MNTHYHRKRKRHKLFNFAIACVLQAIRRRPHVARRISPLHGISTKIAWICPRRRDLFTYFRISLRENRRCWREPKVTRPMAGLFPRMRLGGGCAAFFCTSLLYLCACQWIRAGTSPYSRRGPSNRPLDTERGGARNCIKERLRREDSSRARGVAVPSDSIIIIDLAVKKKNPREY